MRQQLATPKHRSEAQPTDLFGTGLPAEESKLRTSEQRERLARIADELSELLDELDSRLRADRGRAVPIVAEYLGPLETAAENLSRVRDIDEQFGGKGDRLPSMAHHAEQLERGLAYLLGVLSVAVTSQNLSPYNWRLVERDVQEVHAIAGRVISNEQEPSLKAAA